MAANVNTVHYPPANADATSVITLSPVLAPPGPSPRPRCRSTSWGRPSVAGRISPALLTSGGRRRVTVQTCGDLPTIRPIVDGQPSTVFPLQTVSVPSNVNSYVEGDLDAVGVVIW